MGVTAAQQNDPLDRFFIRTTVSIGPCWKHKYKTVGKVTFEKPSLVVVGYLGCSWGANVAATPSMGLQIPRWKLTDNQHLLTKNKRTFIGFNCLYEYEVANVDWSHDSQASCLVPHSLHLPRLSKHTLRFLLPSRSWTITRGSECRFV